MKKSLLKFLSIFVVAFCLFGLNTVFAVESEDQNIVVENTVTEKLIDSVVLDSSEYKININNTTLLSLLSNTSLLDSKIQKDNYVYEYLYVKLSDGETTDLETTTINELSYAKCPFAIAKKVNGSYYPICLSDAKSGTVKITSTDSSREVNYKIATTKNIYEAHIYIGTDAEGSFEIKNESSTFADSITYDRKIGNNDCFVYVKSIVSLGESIELSPFGTLSFTETSEDGYSIYKAPITDKTLFNKDSIHSELIAPDSNVLGIADIKFEGDKIEIKDPSSGNNSKDTGDSSNISIKDSTTNVIITARSGVIADGTTLKATELTEGERFEAIKKVITDSKFKVFNITLLLNGAEVQPNGSVKVSLPIPSGYDKSKLIVYYVDSTGATTKKSVTISEDGNYAVFETDHFSDYVLAESETANGSGNEGTTGSAGSDLDKEPKTGINSPISFVVTVLAVASTGLAVCIKKMSK